MRSFIIGAGLAAVLGVAMFVFLETGAVSQVERYDSVSVNAGHQQGGHVIVQEHPTVN